MEALTSMVTQASDFLWNVILIILLCGTGIMFTIRLKFIQVRKLKEGFKLVFGSMGKKNEGGKKGEIQQQDRPSAQSHGGNGGGEKDSGKGKETEGQRGFLPSQADLAQQQPEGAV